MTLFLLFLVFAKIPFQEILETLKNANLFFLSIGILTFLLSQWISADRLLVLFNANGFNLDPKSNYILYLIGMFYNFFIPGGIGGDAYKVFQLHKEFDWSVKKLSAAVFVDRFMGLTAIGILLLFFAFFIPFFKEENLIWTLPLLLILGIITSYFFIKHVFQTFLNAYIKTLFQSIAVQLLQCVCIITLLAAVTDIDSYLLYVLVFLISSVLSIFSFSGIGIREMIFYQASSFFLFDATIAVTVGLLFSALTAFISLFGVVFHLKKTESYVRKTIRD